MAEEETPRQQLERMGATRVRFLLQQGSLLSPLYGEALQWIDQLDAEELASAKAMQSEQMRIALRANKIAIVAAIAVIVAAIMATVAIVISYLVWIYPIH